MTPFNFTEKAPSYDAAEVFYVRIDPRIGLTGELLRSLYYLLWFPGYFGFNWDALYDCLRDLEWIKFHKIVLVHESLPQLPEDDLKVYLEILRDSALGWVDDESHELEVVFRCADKTVIENILTRGGVSY